MGRARQMERIIAKGQLVPLVFVQSGVTNSQTDVALGIAGYAATAYTLPWEFEVIGAAVESSATVSDGEGSLAVLIDGNAALTLSLDDVTNTDRDSAAAERGRYGGARGSAVSVEITTDADFDISGGDIVVTVFVLGHLEGVRSEEHTS